MDEIISRFTERVKLLRRHPLILNYTNTETSLTNINIYKGKQFKSPIQVPEIHVSIYKDKIIRTPIQDAFSPPDKYSLISLPEVEFESLVARARPLILRGSRKDPFYWKDIINIINRKIIIEPKSAQQEKLKILKRIEHQLILLNNNKLKSKKYTKYLTKKEYTEFAKYHASIDHKFKHGNFSGKYSLMTSHDLAMAYLMVDTVHSGQSTIDETLGHYFETRFESATYFVFKSCQLMIELDNFINEYIFLASEKGDNSHPSQ